VNPHTHEPNETVALNLTRQEALVLFDWLATKGAKVETNDNSEQIVLWKVEAQLEKALTEPFADDYSAILEKARRSVRAAAMEDPDAALDF
jgi:hypothetical protein